VPLTELILMRGALIFVRVAGAMSFAPFFSGSGVQAQTKAVLALLITALLYPTCSIPVAAVTPIGWSKIALGETILGLAIGLCLQFILEGAQLAGQVAGFQFSFSLVNIIDPNTNVDTPVLSVFHQFFAVLFFLQLNVHHWILRGLARSFDYVPVGSVTMVLDVSVGFLTKASPQLPAMLFSIPLKSLVGYGVLAIGIGLWPAIFEKQFVLALGWSERLLHLAH
jgi:flagellar biosynthetic protein FliR